MKIGDIKIEALKIMFANYSFDMGIADLPNMISDENYGSYLVNMDGSIARAIDRIQNACVVPVKSRLISDNERAKGKFFDRFDTSVIEDFYLLDKVVAEDNNGGYDGNAEFQTEGSVLVLRSGLAHTVLYFPKLRTMDITVGDTDDIWLPDYIARLIPLFIKGDLYQEEEPSLAADARNMFEAMLEDLKRPAQGNQTRVRRVL